jgi:hypothetical protein
MKARVLGAQSWAEARRVEDLKQAEADFRRWLPAIMGAFAAVLILLVRGFV